MAVSNIGFVLCRIVAVSFLVQAARGLSWIVPSAFQMDADFLAFGIGILTAIGAPVLGAVVLWKYADRIARVKDAASDAEVSVSIGQDELIEAGILLVGVYAVSFGLIVAVNVESMDWNYRLSVEDGEPYIDDIINRNWSRRLAYLAQILLGIYLVLGRQSILRLVKKARKLGT